LRTYRYENLIELHNDTLAEYNELNEQVGETWFIVSRKAVMLAIYEIDEERQSSMFGFFKKSCAISKRKIKPLRTFRNDWNYVLKVCVACSEYAELRAYRKISK